MPRSGASLEREKQVFIVSVSQPWRRYAARLLCPRDPQGWLAPQPAQRRRALATQPSRPGLTSQWYLRGSPARSSGIYNITFPTAIRLRQQN